MSVLLGDQLHTFQHLDNVAYIVIMYRHSEKVTSWTGLLCG